MYGEQHSKPLNRTPFKSSGQFLGPVRSQLQQLLGHIPFDRRKVSAISGKSFTSADTTSNEKFNEWLAGKNLFPKDSEPAALSFARHRSRNEEVISGRYLPQQSQQSLTEFMSGNSKEIELQMLLNERSSLKDRHLAEQSKESSRFIIFGNTRHASVGRRYEAENTGCLDPHLSLDSHLRRSLEDRGSLFISSREKLQRKFGKNRQTYSDEIDALLLQQKHKSPLNLYADSLERKATMLNSWQQLSLCDEERHRFQKEVSYVAESTLKKLQEASDSRNKKKLSSITYTDESLLPPDDRPSSKALRYFLSHQQLQRKGDHINNNVNVSGTFKLRGTQKDFNLKSILKKEQTINNPSQSYVSPSPNLKRQGNTPKMLLQRVGFC